MNRPMVWVAAGFLCGIAVKAQLPGVPIGVFGVAVLVGAVLGLRAHTRWLGPLGVALVFFGCGALTHGIQHAGPSWDRLCRLALEEEDDAFFRISGTVRSADLYTGENQDYLQAVIDVDRVLYRDEPTPATGRLLLRWSDPGGGLYPGDRVEAMGNIETALSRVNFNAPGAEGTYRLRHIHSAMGVYGENGVAIASRGSILNPRNAAARFRAALAARLEAAIPEESHPFIFTVWLGDRRRLDNATYQTFLESGTAHILAVSGVHTGIVFLSLAGALGMAVKRPRRRNVILIAFILFFALMAGARVSSIRAACMLSIYLLAEIFDREPDPPTALSLAALGFTVYDTNTLFETGFQLSFLSVASILVFYSALSRRWPWFQRPAGQAVAATLAVQIFAIPVAILHFAVLPLAGPLVNLVVVPMLTVTLWLCLLTSICSFVFEPVAALFGHALHACAWLIERIAAFVADIPGGHLYLPAPTVFAMAAYAMAALFLYATLRKTISTRNGILATAASVFLAIALWTPLRTEPSITFLDVGHGDATVVISPGGSRLLVDAGNRVDGDSFELDRGRDTVAPYLWKNHMARLDAVAVTHADSDHHGGLRYILERFPVGAFYMPASILEFEPILRLIAICGARGIPIVRLAQGDTIPLAGATCTVEHPVAGWEPRGEDGRNEDSLVLRVAWPGMNALLTADIEEDAERALTPHIESADVMTMPHHGSQTSSSPAFLDAVQPVIAIASTGKRRGGPVFRDFVADRYRERGAAVLRTDYLGAVRVQADDAGLYVRSAREGFGFPARGPLPPR